MKHTALSLLLLLSGLAACNGAQPRYVGRGRLDAGASDSDGGTPVSDAALRNRDSACGVARADALLVKRPLDIIIVIDNSGSMVSKIQAVENNINQNFAQIIDKSGVDYRVIMLSRHGSAVGEVAICVKPPLSGNPTCDPPPPTPVNTSRFFQYSLRIQSNDALALILKTYNAPDPNGQSPSGWSGWLRPDALKAFILITDDNSSMPADAFLARLRTLQPPSFGDINSVGGTVVHSIIGLGQNTPATTAWPPTAAMVSATCGNLAVNNGAVYQTLSRATGGLRFPICELASYDAVFQAVAQGVVDRVSCTLAIPEAPPGQKIDYSSLVVVHTPGSGARHLTGFGLTQGAWP